MPSPIIEVHGLRKCFGSFCAVDSINFSIEQGEILGFLGPNGAGKTTTIKMILGLIPLSAGKIYMRDQDLQQHRREFKRSLGYMSQKFSLYPLLTSRENIEFFGGVCGLGRSVIAARLEELGQLIPPDMQRQKVSDIPPGFRQKVALLASLLGNPEILFLDEPTSGVDPVQRRSFWNSIYQLKKAGKTILVSTHNLDEVEYADRMIMIHRGRIILDGEPEALQKQRGKNSVEELFREAILEDDRRVAGRGQ